jgi:hypothetical protein
MKTLTKIKYISHPLARLRMKLFNQKVKFQKEELAEVNLLANESNFETCEIHNRIDKLKVDSTYSEWRVVE